MTNCLHAFITIHRNEHWNTEGNRHADFYAIIVCAYCGQVRHIYDFGLVDIVKEYGEVKNAPSNTTD